MQGGATPGPTPGRGEGLSRVGPHDEPERVEHARALARRHVGIPPRRAGRHLPAALSFWLRGADRGTPRRIDASSRLPRNGEHNMAVDEAKLNEFMGNFVRDMGAVAHAATVVVG